jgi:hypothetical protein
MRTVFFGGFAVIIAIASVGHVHAMGGGGTLTRGGNNFNAPRPPPPPPPPPPVYTATPNHTVGHGLSVTGSQTR